MEGHPLSLVQRAHTCNKSLAYTHSYLFFYKIESYRGDPNNTNLLSLLYNMWRVYTILTPVMEISRKSKIEHGLEEATSGFIVNASDICIDVSCPKNGGIRADLDKRNEQNMSKDDRVPCVYSGLLLGVA